MPLGSFEFLENWCSEILTSLKGVNEMFPYFHFSSDLDKIRYRRFPEKFIALMSFVKTETIEIVLFLGTQNNLYSYCPCFLSDYYEFGTELCIKCCWLAVSFLKIGSRKSVHLL
jgi:hypothetical protein